MTKYGSEDDTTNMLHADFFQLNVFMCLTMHSDGLTTFIVELESYMVIFLWFPMDR